MNLIFNDRNINLHATTYKSSWWILILNKAVTNATGTQIPFFSVWKEKVLKYIFKISEKCSYNVFRFIFLHKRHIFQKIKMLSMKPSCPRKAKYWTTLDKFFPKKLLKKKKAWTRKISSKRILWRPTKDNLKIHWKMNRQSFLSVFIYKKITELVSLQLPHIHQILLLSHQ